MCLIFAFLPQKQTQNRGYGVAFSHENFLRHRLLGAHRGRDEEGGQSGDRTSQLPMHGLRKELGTKLIAKIKKDAGVDLMLSYPVELEDDDGTVLITSPDFPELTTFGDDRAEALARAVDALDEAIAARIHEGREIPSPSSGQQRAKLPTLTAIKVILYQGMRDQGIGEAELARRLGWHLPQVDRVLDINHRSRLDRMDAALGAIGRRLSVIVEEDTSMPA